MVVDRADGDEGDVRNCGVLLRGVDVPEGWRLLTTGEDERCTDGLRVIVVGEGLGDALRTEGLRTDGLTLERLCVGLGSENFGTLLLDPLLLDRGAVTAGLDDRDEDDGLKLRETDDDRGADENEREGDRLTDALGLGRLMEDRGLDDRTERDADGDRLTERAEPPDDPREERAIAVVSVTSSKAAAKATRRIQKPERCVNMTTPRPVGVVESAGEAPRQTT